MTPRAKLETQHARLELQRSEERLRALLDAIDDMIFRLDADGRFTDWKAAATDPLIVPPEHFLGRHFRDVLPALASHNLAEAIEAAKQSRSVQTFEYELTLPAIGQQFYEARVKVTDAGDVFAVCRNVTARKQADDLFKTRKAQLRELADAVPHIVWTANPEGELLYLNRRGVEYLGDQFGNVLQQQWQRSIHPDDLPPLLQTLAESLTTGVSRDTEYRIRRADGEYRWHVTRAVAIRDQHGAILRWIGTSTDIHDRKRVEHALRDSEERLHLAAEVAQIGMWDRDLKTNRLYWSPSQERLMGYEPGTFPGTYEAFCALVHPADQPIQAEARRRALAEGGRYQAELRFRLRDGRERWGLVRGQIIFDEQGQPQRILGIELDITEHKRAEEALRASESRFRALVEHGYDGITIIDARESVTYSSPANEQILGYAAAQIQGRAGLSLAHPDDLPRARATLAALMRSPEQVFHETLRLRHKNGDWRWIECRLCNLLDHPSIQGIVINWRDISDRMKLERDLSLKNLIMERIAAGTALKDVLDEIVSLIEDQVPNSLCSILLLDPEGRRLKLGAGKSLPAEYNAAIDGVAIGPAVGSCGTAAFRGDAVIVSDIASDPLWANYRDLALAHGLRSCWSMPILSSKGGDEPDGRRRVLGTFAIYRREPGTPTPADLNAVASAAHLAGIAIERQQAEEALQKEHLRFKQLVTAAPGVICAFQQGVDGTLSMPDSSPGLADLLGVTPTEVRLDAAAILQRIHPADIEHVRQAIAESALTLRMWDTEFRFLHPIKGEVWIEGRVIPNRQPDGSIFGYGILTDVTKRRLAEVEFRRTAQLLKAVADGTTDAVFVKDRNGKYLLFNEAAARFVGRPVAEVLGQDDTQLFEPASARTVMERDRHVIATGEADTSEESLTANGQTRTYLATKAPYRDELGNVVGVIGISRDISERKQTEIQLIESEERYRRLVDLLPDAVFICRLDEIVFCNSALVRFIGASDAGQLVGRSPLELMNVRHHEGVRQRIRDMLASGRPAPSRESEFFRRDGSTVRAFVAATPIAYHGQPSILVVLHDLSELRRSAELLQSVMQSVNDAIVTIDERGIVQTINPAAERLFGYSTVELVGSHVSILMPAHYRAAHEDQIAKYLRTGIAKIIGTGREVEGRRKDGTTFPAELEITEFTLNDVRHFSGVMRDITARKALEAQFRQAQKMEAIGQLAGGIAHDFNNLLCVINGYAEMLVQHTAPSDASYDWLQQIYAAGKRSADLTKQLLAFGRQAMIEPKLLNLNDVVGRIEKMLRRLIGEDISLSTVLDPELCAVKVDPGQFEQVLVNLVVNARDALPHGGQIIIATRNVVIEPIPTHPQSELVPGRYAELAVSDNGLGMTDEVKARIFDPFFTTKEIGKGTGLGLAVVHGIVKQSEGHIEVLTRRAAGTTFRILLPSAAVPIAESLQRSEGQFPLRGEETILVVEDEAAVLAVAKRALESAGYEVLSVENGLDALELLDQKQQEIDLLVTDVVMPEMSGRQLADIVHIRFPTLPILYLSGYTADEVIRRGLMHSDVEFLQKPFSLRSFLGKVREVLDRES